MKKKIGSIIGHALTSYVIPLILGAFALLNAGCITSAGQSNPGYGGALERTPDKVEVLYYEPQQAYYVVGDVSVRQSIYGDEDQTKRKFQAVGGSLGADAVIVTALPHFSFFCPTVLGKGKAIRWASSPPSAYVAHPAASWPQGVAR